MNLIKKMKHILIVVFSLITILITSSCEKENDIILEVKVIDRYDSTAIENIAVSVRKRKPAYMWGYTTVDTYSGMTDNTGVCKLMIDDYDKEKYDYNIDVI